MKKARKIVSLLLCCIMVISMGTVSASAFGGYAHWTIASVRMDLNDSQALSENIKLAYKSGCLLADIGAVFMDHYYNFDTDDIQFTQEIYNLAMEQNNEMAKAFAFGWRDHYLQDELGDVNHLYYEPDVNGVVQKGPYDEYHRNYGWIDEYLRDELQLVEDYPIQNNSISQMYVNYGLIQGAYERMGVSAPSQGIINANIIAMCIAYDGFILLNFKGWTSAQRSRISTEIFAMALISLGVNEGIPYSTLSNDSENTIEERNCSAQNYNLFTAQEMNELSQYYSIETTDISDEEAFVSVSKNDIESYNRALSRIVSEKMAVLEECEIY